MSLSTEHKNAQARRRINVHTANHLTREYFGVAAQGLDVDGITPHVKQAFARTVRYLGKAFGKKKEQFVYPKTFVVDPEAPYGFRLLDAEAHPVVAPHQELAAVTV